MCATKQVRGSEVLPLQKRGTEKVSAMLKGEGTTSFEVI